MRNLKLLFTVFAATAVIGCGQPSEVAVQSEEAAAPTTAPTEAAPAEPTPEPTPEPTTPPASADTWEGWFQSHPNWVGSIRELTFQADAQNKSGDGVESSLKVNAKKGDNLIRDVYLARVEGGLEAGKKYKISLMYRFDSPDAKRNSIQYRVFDGDHANQKAIQEMEDYEDHPMPETHKVDPATIGDNAFHALEVEHTLGEGQDSLTFAMIVRLRSREMRDNWFFFDSYKIEEVQ